MESETGASTTDFTRSILQVELREEEFLRSIPPMRIDLEDFEETVQEVKARVEVPQVAVDETLQRINNWMVVAQVDINQLETNARAHITCIKRMRDIQGDDDNMIGFIMNQLETLTEQRKSIVSAIENACVQMKTELETLKTLIDSESEEQESA
ncbi:hypothetical protein XA68_11418 [Ophiocordyceps unilateralis]|uniref:Uncharacterized protein n=1 Tax=Ophiocordyceps unilateralis TaxID=268505 RepID=A0A2A9PPT0_OPHUN|nr:hypothetical protein XA68_11418 [Ophiocordyceps unilateralis]